MSKLTRISKSKAEYDAIFVPARTSIRKQMEIYTNIRHTRVFVSCKHAAYFIVCFIDLPEFTNNLELSVIRLCSPKRNIYSCLECFLLWDLIADK
jgi:hypothetical protein